MRSRLLKALLTLCFIGGVAVSITNFFGNVNRIGLPVVAFGHLLERFEFISLANYLSYDMSKLDILSSESGGARLFVDRETKNKFPQNYKNLRKKFSGTELHLEGNKLLIDTKYAKANINMEVVEGVYPLNPVKKGLSGFKIDHMMLPSPYKGNYLNALSYRARLAGEKARASLSAEVELPPGNYQLWMRILKSREKNSAVISVEVDGKVLGSPDILSETKEYGWVFAGTFETDGKSTVTINAKGRKSRTVEAAIHYIVARPTQMEGSGNLEIDFGEKIKVTATGNKGILIPLEKPVEGGYTIAIAADPSRKEILSLRWKN